MPPEVIGHFIPHYSLMIVVTAVALFIASSIPSKKEEETSREDGASQSAKSSDPSLSLTQNHQVISSIMSWLLIVSPLSVLSRAGDGAGCERVSPF
ncbi:MAG: hypothetical protein J2P36_19310 [Ktedonobacteraceae bacterium]|nr:hypothetical protein [Ktedonobacteraceae bacterium]